MLAKVAIARKQLQLDEAAYRSVLERTIGCNSARLASDAQLHRLLGEFGRLGFVATPPQHSRARSEKGHARLIVALWAELALYLRDSSAEVLRHFVQRQTRSTLHPDGVAAPEFLDGKQAAKVIEGLKAWLARERKRAEGSEAA
jgi:hypothetical protein